LAALLLKPHKKGQTQKGVRTILQGKEF